MQTDLKIRQADPLGEAEDLEQLYQLAIRVRVLYPSRATEELDWGDTRVARAVRLLREGGLLRPLADDRADALVPVAPRTAASRRLARLHTQIARMEQESDAIRAELAVFQELHEQATRESRLVEPCQTVAGADAIAAEIAALAEDCDSEVLVARPGGGRSIADALQVAWESPEVKLARRVRSRILYQHAARFDRPTREHVEQLVAVGGEVRTLGDPFDQMIIFDRDVAVIPADGDRDVAVIVRQAGVVDFLLGVFERAWVSASPFESQNRAAEVSELISGVRMSIIQLLAEGETDEAIARRIGVSVRTCRSHVAKIYQELGARSRCQLGVLIAQSGLLRQG
ncbi:LuxR C-terminal-related transcriptional regulator [Kitasatospora sp. NPDC052896]|uniref:helix-turn-helix transcriptional regulator n=1 Tax=Kitasatospora sp. NPDC052896 TaxID=3364061 RepID=UPI0037C64F2A